MIDYSPALILTDVERPLKERLVGAAVLMAAAVILIPEMLSGQRRMPAQSSAPTATVAPRGEGDRKRYNIDLNGVQPPAVVPEVSNVVEEPAPAAEDPALPAEDIAQPQAPTPALAASPGESETAAVLDPGNATAVQQDLPAVAVTQEPSVSSSAALPPQATEHVPAATKPVSSRRWAVQLIAYDNRERAQRMAEDLREGNYAAFVMPVQSGKSTLYRVRVGPFATRTEAEDALRKLKTVTSDPAIVAQP